MNSHLTLLKILMRTKNKVTRSPILPGTTCGLIKKLTQLTITNMKLGKYTCENVFINNIIVE